MRSTRGHDDRTAGVRQAQQRVQRTDQAPCRRDVDVHDPLEDLCLDMAERRYDAKYPSIGHENIELAPALVDRSAKAVDAGHVGEVQWHQRGLSAGLLDLVVKFLEPTDGPRDGNHMRAGGG